VISHGKKGLLPDSWRFTRENSRGIQEAFREFAKRFHPDHAGLAGSGKFQDILEAYEILSNAEKRKLYDHEIEQSEITDHSGPQPIVFHRSPRPQPLVPEPMSVLHDFETILPSFEPLYERLRRNFTGERIPKGERLEGLNVEVILSPEQAVWGLTIPMEVPVFFACPQCGGSGRDWLFPCVNCNAQGIIEAEKTIEVRIPLIVPDTTVVETPIQGLGIHNFYLRLHIRISR
jgi:molecular chaperone DnaJ/curved DNA-binding protein